mmetsp:Transcript_25736/g.75425  ORF Transcript_25736/g.75425 Transcript_25736/m.75425 type:complete len:208 (-) Transcript_25736:326-949(-)
MGAPNAVRSAAYFVATSRDAWAMPRACAAIPMRPPSRVVMAILKPSPGLPRRFALGTRTLSRMRLAVDEPRMPSLSSLAPRLKPGASQGTRKALIPLCFLLLSVVAKTIAAEASWALVIHALVPLRKKWSGPSSTAVVEAAPASEPFPGSERPKQPSFSPLAKGVSHSSFCSSVAYLRTGAQYRLLLALMMTPVDAHPREISSRDTA